MKSAYSLEGELNLEAQRRMLLKKFAADLAPEPHTELSDEECAEILSVCLDRPSGFFLKLIKSGGVIGRNLVVQLSKILGERGHSVSAVELKILRSSGNGKIYERSNLLTGGSDKGSPRPGFVIRTIGRRKKSLAE